MTVTERVESVQIKRTTHLEVVSEPDGDRRRSLQDQVLDLLAKTTVLTRAKLRDALAVKIERLGGVLDSLEQAGPLRRTPAGWQRTDPSEEDRSPFPI